MKKLILSTIVLVGAVVIYNSVKSPSVQQEVVENFEKTKVKRKKKVEKVISKEVSKEVVTKVTNPKGGDALEEYKDNEIDSGESKDISKTVTDLSRCLLAGTCEDLKKTDKYYDPNKGTFHRALVNSFDMLRYKLKDESVDIPVEDVINSLKIQNDKVQSAAALLLMEVEDQRAKEGIIENCSYATNSNIKSYMGLISNDKHFASSDFSRSRKKCFKGVSRRPSAMARNNLLSFFSSAKLDSSEVKESLKNYCKTINSKSETNRRMLSKFKNILDKYSLRYKDVCN